MSRVVDYELIGAGDAREATKQVKDRIKDGWRPFGGPFSHEGQIVQAMVMKGRAGKRIRKSSEDD